MSALVVTPLQRMPEVSAGDDLARIIAAALMDNGIELATDDVLAVSSKIVSKALGLTVVAPDRESVVAGQSEWVVAERTVVDPDTGVVRTSRVVKAVAGPVMAAAGVDGSNTGGHDHLLLLPRDPDAATRDLYDALAVTTGVTGFGIVVTDTAGRAWRVGQTDFALGSAGLVALHGYGGAHDRQGNELLVTEVAVADEIAAAADLVKGKALAVPVAHLRGLPPGTVVPVRSGDDAGGAGAGEAGTGGSTVATGASGPAGAAAAAAAAAATGAATLVRTGPTDWFGLGRAESVRAALGVPPGSALSERIGIASAAPEGVDARLARAVGVAIHDRPDVGVDVGRGFSARSSGSAAPAVDEVVVSGGDPLEVGIAVGRLLVALWGELLEGTVTVRAETSVTVVVTDQA